MAKRPNRAASSDSNRSPDAATESASPRRPAQHPDTANEHTIPAGTHKHRAHTERTLSANRPDRTTNSRREPSAKPRDRTTSPAPPRAPNRPAANPAAKAGALLPHTERPAEPETGIRRVYPYIGHRAALETRRSQRGSARRGHSAGAVSRRRRQSCRASRPRRHSPGDAPRGGSIRRCR